MFLPPSKMDAGVDQWRMETEATAAEEAEFTSAAATSKHEPGRGGSWITGPAGNVYVHPCRGAA